MFGTEFLLHLLVRPLQIQRASIGPVNCLCAPSPRSCARDTPPDRHLAWQPLPRPIVAASSPGLRQGKAAVRAVIVEPWSNGPAEGQIDRLKLIQRSM